MIRFPNSHLVYALTWYGLALLVVVGGYVGYYGIYELRLNFAHAGPRDLVIETAQAVQQTLLAWLDAIGRWPLIAALVALVAVAVALGKRAKSAIQRCRDQSSIQQIIGVRAGLC